LPVGSSDLYLDVAGNHFFISPFGLAPGGVYIAYPVAWMLVSSYLTFPPLPAKCRRYLSVALSLESPPLGVTQHPALWSSDFPHLPFGRCDHSAYSSNINVDIISYHIIFKMSIGIYWH